MNDRDRAAGEAKKWEAAEQGAMTTRLSGGDVKKALSEMRLYLNEIGEFAGKIQNSAAGNPIAVAQAGKIASLASSTLKHFATVDDHFNSKEKQAKAQQAAAAVGGEVITDHLTALIDGLPQTKYAIATYLEKSFGTFNYQVGTIGQRPSITIPTIDEVGTHAFHSIIKNDDPELLSAIYAKTGWPDVAGGITELFELAGYYSPSGKDFPYKRTNILPFLMSPAIIGALPKENLNEIFAGIAMVGVDSSASLYQFIENLGEKVSEINFENVFLKALWNEGTSSVGTTSNIRTLIEILKENHSIISSGLLHAATKQTKKDREGLADDPYHLQVNQMLIDAAPKPIDLETIKAIARSGYEATLKSAIIHCQIDDLPKVLQAISTEITATPENNILAVIEAIQDANITIPSDILFESLKNAIQKGQKETLGTLTEIVQQLPQEESFALINRTEDGRRHPNKGGNVLLYAAANYSRNSSHSDTQKAEDVNTAITLIYKLASAGANLLSQNNEGKTSVEILNTRVAGKGKDLEGSQILRLLNSQFDTLLRAQQESLVRLATLHTEQTGKAPMLMGSGGMGGLGGLLALQQNTSPQQQPVHQLSAGTTPTPSVRSGEVIEPEFDEVEIIPPPSRARG